MMSQPHILVQATAQNPWWKVGRLIDRPFLQRRDIHQRLCQRIGDGEQRRATLLIGPRQVGKSVLLRQVVETLLDEGCPPANVTYFDFKDFRVQGLRPPIGPGDVAELEPAGTQPEVPRVLLLDEITAAPNWSQWLKQAVDQDRRNARSKVRILATDSAAATLRHGSVDSGQGRWDEERILGLSFPEYVRFQCRPGESEEDLFGRAPDPLAGYLAKGGFPEHVAAEPSEEQRRRVREDIVERAIRRDLPTVRGTGRRAERLDLERLTSLFVFLAQESGGIFQPGSRARDLEAHRTTVTGWVRMLEDACLIHRIEPFHPSSRRAGPKASRRLAMKPKLYVHEHGLIPALALSSEPMNEPRVRAAIAETVVLRHILDLVPRREAVHYFRRKDNLEIDFLFEVGERRYAVEVTASEHATSKELGRLRAAGSEAEADEVVLIHSARDEARANGVRLLPLRQFLRRPPGLLEVQP